MIEKHKTVTVGWCDNGLAHTDRLLWVDSDVVLDPQALRKLWLARAHRRLPHLQVPGGPAAEALPEPL